MEVITITHEFCMTCYDAGDKVVQSFSDRYAADIAPTIEEVLTDAECGFDVEDHMCEDPTPLTADDHVCDCWCHDVPESDIE